MDDMASEHPAVDASIAAPLADDRPVITAETQLHDPAPAICRICRGEGTTSEPLFYPCKCNGSIKYVHQDCLMEWLSHTQKKYCELCKTPFRFTKLYAPDMPQSLPVHVVIEHMGKYLFRNCLVWLRAAVAISVWVFWLPYFMRSVWSFMFWVSDEGLGTSVMSRAAPSHAVGRYVASAMNANGTCPATPLLAPTTTPAAAAHAILDSLQVPSMSEFFIRLLLASIGMPMQTEPSSNASAVPGAPEVPQGSFLSEVAFLRSLTRSPTLHRTLVSVLEGQLITVLVILSFILVILVRDYVVQQQPEINNRAAFAGLDEAPQQQPLQQEQEQHQEIPELVEPQPVPRVVPLALPATESDDETLDEGETGRSEMFDNWQANDAGGSDTTEAPPLPEDATAAFTQRPIGPRLDNTEPTAEAGTQTGRPEETVTSDVSDYLRIYRQADGDPERMQQIAEAEGIQDRLDYYMDIGRRSREGRRRDEAFVENRPSQPVQAGSASSQARESSSSRPALSLVTQPPYPTRDFTPVDDNTNDKQPEGLFGLPSREVAPLNLGVGSSRQRANSDGPQPSDTIHPLANSSWSFAPLGDASNNSNTSPAPGAASDSLFAAQPEDLTLPSASETEDDDFEQVNMTPEQPEIDRVEAIEAMDTVAELAPPLEQVAEATEAVAAPNQPELAGLVGRVAEFMWGGLEEHQDVPAPEPQEEDDEDGPWVDVPADELANDNAPIAGEVDEAAGVDAEAIEDMDDFEGVAELIGMRGPIAGLFQNAIFCSVLVSVTIFACIFIPYNMGRVTLWIMANPMRLLRMLFELSKFVQDLAVIVGGIFTWCALNIVDIFTGFIGGNLAAQVFAARKSIWVLWTGAASRLLACAFMDFPTSAVEVRNFSAISHGALLTVKGNIAAGWEAVGGLFSLLLGGGIGQTLSTIHNGIASFLGYFSGFSAVLVNPNAWVIDLGESDKAEPVDPALAYWPSNDRFWAILAGYITVFVFGAMYLKRGSPAGRGMVQAWEAGIIDFLLQASGIMKVILIISIEMLVFPLYCGLLLDAALLPLFEAATFKSRMLFTYNYPLTSVFVHWFIGTGYMFHFALFVSMCRKIMRPGVLYFIRDPDDPEFHPVRDVLERNLATQLRKILFSAFVYGALVIVCLGGVVWGLSYTVPVLPIHYSSNEPVLEFPVDLLFYNFMAPLAVKFFRPSRGLQVMYTWWFRKCARALRLTYFLFGERRIDEEGDLHLPVDSEHQNAHPLRRMLLEVDQDTNQVVPKTWRDTWEGGYAKPTRHTSRRNAKTHRRAKAKLVETGQIEHTGRFVRAPASDRIKIPKGRRIFLTVSERNHRKDGNPDTDQYASDQYEMVYIPPNFRARLFIFILFIWLFAAITGIGFTIIPLVFGRRIFKDLIPQDIRTNDIYAFSIGVCLLGSVAYSLLHWQSIQAKIKDWFNTYRNEYINGNAGLLSKAAGLHALKLVYSYFFILVAFPLLISCCVDLYVLMPLHTHMNPPTAASIQAPRDESNGTGRHTLRLTQVWTLGLLYLHLAYNTIQHLLPNSRLATAARVVTTRGWLHPQVGVLTRAFIVPGLGLASFAIFGPPMMTSFLIRNGVFSTGQPIINEAMEAARVAIIYRYAYPATALLAVVVRNAIGMVKVFNGWTAKIRDEAYLIGERLHNFGAVTAGSRKGRASWRASGARL